MKSWRQLIGMAAAMAISHLGGNDAEGQSAAQSHRKTEVLSAFSYRDVNLTDGPLAAQAKAARDFYVGLSDDNLLNGFRQRAKLPAPGKPMGGWYDPDDFAGAHPFGQYISGLSRMFAQTGDPQFQEKVARLVHGFHETIATDGFFFSSAKVAKNWPCYVYDKNCTGMRDAYTLTGDQEALVVLNQMTDWAFEKLPRTHDEWYTLPENLYNCYALTRDKRYLQMAGEYDYSRDYYDAFAGGSNALTSERHAYSHINSLCSAAKAYEVTGNEKYFKIVSNAWEFLTGTQMYASGGWGPNEHFVTAGQGKLATSLAQTKGGDHGNDFETPCGTYANANLDRYLLRFTGNPKYGDNMERVLYNGILAALPMQPDGRTFYYSDYHPGAQKQYYPAAWPCCSGTYAEVTADYPLDIYFHDKDALYVNLFAPSQLRWRHGKKIVSVEQKTDFPQSDTMTFIIHSENSARFSLNVRVPEWAAQTPRVRLDGQPLKKALQVSPGTFLKISRTWRDGDVVDVKFPMSLRFEPIDAQNPHLAALMYGPLLLVAIADGEVDLQGDQNRPADWLESQGPDTLAFRTHDGKTTFRPFYLIQDERYTTYCHISPIAGQ